MPKVSLSLLLVDTVQIWLQIALYSPYYLLQYILMLIFYNWIKVIIEGIIIIKARRIAYTYTQYKGTIDGLINEIFVWPRKLIDNTPIFC